MMKNIYVWENSSGTMFISWTEKKTSLMYDDPKSIEIMASYIGVSPNIIRNAIKKAKEELKGLDEKRFRTA